MNAASFSRRMFVGASIVGCSSWVALAADKDKADDVGHGPTYRAKDLMGMAVKNPADESLGKIEDVVIDLDTGHIRYAVLSFGGFLGVHDKLFAVPWKTLHIVADKNGKGHHVQLSVDKERLKTAPGFPKDHWPDYANPAWSTSVENFYKPRT